MRTRCATETDEGEYVETRTYDALGHLLTQTHTRPDGSISYQVQYTLAPDGNRLSAIETRDSGVATWDYTYDRLGRLEREQRTDSEGLGRDITYTYDADSNRVEADNALNDDLDETYTYDTNGRLDRVTRGDGTYTVYSWTLNGEQSQVSEFDAQDNETKRQEFAWGGAGDRTLESVTFSESDGSGGLALQGRVEYDYDHAGEKIARRVYDAGGPGTPESGEGGTLLSHRKYLVDHQNPTGYSQTLAELEIVDPDTGQPSESSNAVARVARLNTFAPLGPVAQTDFQQTDTGLSKTYRHLFADPLGSIRTLTSQTDSGTIESAAEDYPPFGTPMNGSLTSGDPPEATPQYAFTGQSRDPYSGLQYHRARWLNTGIGQWTSSDPVFDFTGSFGGAFGYVARNPLNSLDPGGQAAFVTTAGLISAFLAGSVLFFVGLAALRYVLDKVHTFILTFYDRGFERRHFGYRKYTSRALIVKSSGAAGDHAVWYEESILKPWKKRLSRSGYCVDIVSGSKSEIVARTAGKKYNALVIIGHGDGESFAGLEYGDVVALAAPAGFDLFAPINCWSEAAVANNLRDGKRIPMHPDGLVLTYSGMGLPAADNHIAQRIYNWWFWKSPPLTGENKGQAYSEIMTDYVSAWCLWPMLLAQSVYKFVMVPSAYNELDDVY